MDQPYQQFWLIPSYWPSQSASWEYAPVQPTVTWEQIHGLNEEGKNPNHQPESKEWA